MSYSLNSKISNLSAYEIRLDANESPYLPDDEFLNEFKDAIESIEFNRYPDPCAAELTKAFSDYYEISEDCVTVSNGSDEMLSILESTFLEKGDRVLVIEPDFSMYRFYSSLYEVECISIDKDSNLNVDLESVLKKIQEEKISMVIFSNPCNPTGQGIEADKVRNFIRKADCLVILDEAYMDFWNQSLIKETQSFDNLVVLRTASKAVGCAALRLGFAVSNKTITSALKAVKSPYNVNSVSQKFGTIVYKNKIKLKNRLKNIVNNRDLLYNKLKVIQNDVMTFEVMPATANFVYIKTPDAEQIQEFLRNNSIAVRNIGNGLRITAGTEQEINETVDTIKLFFKQRGV